MSSQQFTANLDGLNEGKDFAKDLLKVVLYPEREREPIIAKKANPVRGSTVNMHVLRISYEWYPNPLNTNRICDHVTYGFRPTCSEKAHGSVVSLPAAGRKSHSICYSFVICVHILFASYLIRFLFVSF